MFDAVCKLQAYAGLPRRKRSGGTRQLIFQPYLQVGQSYQQADDTDGCFMLIEAQYK